jgi:hypothetical protein
MQIDSDDAVFHFAGENTRSTRNAELCAIVQGSPDLLSLLEEYGGNSPFIAVANALAAVRCT